MEELDRALGPSGGLAAKSATRPAVGYVLQQRKAELTIELCRIDEALKALAENPEIERVLNLVSRAIGRY